MTNRAATFRLDEQQTVSGMRLIMDQRLKLPLWPLLVFGLPIAVLAIFLGGDGILGQALPIMGWLVLILGAVVAIIQYWTLPRQVRRSFHQTSLLGEEMTFEWNEDGFAVSSDRASTRLDWTDLHAWGERDELFVLLQSEVLFNLVPQTALSQDQVADLRGCLEASGLKRI